MSTGGLRIRTEYRGQICVLGVHGTLDRAGSGQLAEQIREARAAQPARLVLDLSGVASMDSGGARALSALARPEPGQCPVLVRALRPANRRLFEQAAPEADGQALAVAQPPSRNWDHLLAQSPTGSLVREWQHLQGSAAHAFSDGYRAAQRLASTEDRVAATMRRLAVRRPKASARLVLLSQTARDYAGWLRELAPSPPAPGPAAGPVRVTPPYTATSTVGRAVAFIEERAHEDISAADIAAAAFVSVRAVQLAFRRQLGITPLGYLRQIRLERARDQLLSAGRDGITVSSVAADWHFASASRFAAHYRDAYGVLPGQALRSRPGAGRVARVAAGRDGGPGRCVAGLPAGTGSA